jgi:hypothetical protein
MCTLLFQHKQTCISVATEKYCLFYLPDSIGIPSNGAEILRDSDQHCGWSRYKVSFGTRPGSMNRTCAGSELEPWKAKFTVSQSFHQNLQNKEAQAFAEMQLDDHE